MTHRRRGRSRRGAFVTTAPRRGSEMAGWRRCAMAKRPRCAEFRRRYTPAATPGDRQRTCGPECRLARRRRRRGRGVHAILRATEPQKRARQDVHREGRDPAVDGSGCHAPASAVIPAALQDHVRRIVAEAARRLSCEHAQTRETSSREPSNTSGEHSGTGIGRGSLDAQRDKLRASCKLNDIDRVNRHCG